MKIENLTVSYGNNVVLDGFSATFNKGEITCVLGRSGAGKTTLLRYIAGLLDKKPQEVNAVSMVFQEPRLLENLTVKENLLFAGANEKDIEFALKESGLTNKENVLASKLSGGEKQRVNFLRALLNKSEIMLLDEPFSSLDLATKLPLLESFCNLIKTTKKTAILVTHDLEEAFVLADRILVLSGGKITLDISLKGVPPRKYGESYNEKQLILTELLK